MVSNITNEFYLQTQNGFKYCNQTLIIYLDIVKLFDVLKFNSFIRNHLYSFKFYNISLVIIFNVIHLHSMNFWAFLFICRDAVSLFYNPSRLDFNLFEGE